MTWRPQSVAASLQQAFGLEHIHVHTEIDKGHTEILNPLLLTLLDPAYVVPSAVPFILLSFSVLQWETLAC